MPLNNDIIDGLNAEFQFIIEFITNHNIIFKEQLLITEIEFKIKNLNQEIIIDKNVKMQLKA